MAADLLGRRRRDRDYGHVKRGIEWLDQSPVEEQVLVQAIRPFFEGLGEPCPRVQVAEQAQHLLDSGLSAESATPLAQVKQVDQEAFVQVSVADRRVGQGKVEFPRLPARQLSPQPKETVDAIE